MQFPGYALPALSPLYEALADAAGNELPGLGGPLEAELWTSRQLGALEAEAPDGTALRAALTDLAGHLRTAATPGAALFLRGLAALGPARLRRGAGVLAAQLPAGPPAWAPEIGAAVATEAYVLQDGSLDGDRVGLELRHPGGGTHAVLVRLPGEKPEDPLVIGDVPGMRAQVAAAVRAEECVLLRVPPASAGERLAAAYAGPVPPAALPTAALVRQRAEIALAAR